MAAATEAEVLALERAGWEALATAGAAGPFYANVLADQVLMLLPGGMVLDDREQVVEAMGGPPWDRYELADERVLELSDDSAVVAYRATARRGATEYTALFTSTYVRRASGWKLALHQQTPI